MPILNWIAKEKVVKHDKDLPFRVLKPNSKLSVGNEKDNLLIEGDNLEALKSLLPFYYNQINCVYIDPPYNTNNDEWIYSDRVDSPQIKEWLDEVVGPEGEDLCRHDKWLCMMYPRLKLLRELLRDDGVIFVSIDDNELSNLKQILDEIFLRKNFVGILKWKRKKQPSFLHGHVAKVMEYVLVYAKDISKLDKLSLETRTDSNTRLDNSGNAVAERHFKAGIRVKLPQHIEVIQKGEYKIKTMTIEYLNDVHIKNGRTTNDVKIRAAFRNNQDQINGFVDNDLMFITANNGLRRDLSTEEKNKKKSITDLLTDWGDNQDSDKEIRALFGSKAFDYPKPVKLIKNLIKSAGFKDGIVLDSFAGSGTTGQAVLELNKEDGGNRKFILVELEEKIAKNVTSQRLKKTIHGYKGANHEEGTGGSFQYLEHNGELFDSAGLINKAAEYEDLASYIFFTETKSYLDLKSIHAPFIGNDEYSDYYLLFGKKTRNNILNDKLAEEISSQKKAIVYADKCLVDEDKLTRLNIVFKQIPYELKRY